MAETDIIVRMEDLIAVWEQRADRRADFLRCYRLMTGNMMLAIEAGEFHDGPWVRRLLHHFANYYFTALSDYDYKRERTPAVWAAAHRTARQPETLVLQNLLLGINAHINYDLVLTLYDILSPEWEALSSSARRRRYEDHRRVNVVIGRTIDSVQENVVEQREPWMDLVDKLLGPVDEWTASILIRRWRDEVWRHAGQMLAAKSESQREAVRRQIEAVTLRRARTIIGPASRHLLDQFM